jgi:hypothetical protein
VAGNLNFENKTTTARVVTISKIKAGIEDDMNLSFKKSN